jgi:hypothetical protein
MNNEEDPYKFDRTAFQAMTVEQADNYQRDYSNYSVNQRLGIALYLTGIAYNFDIANPPKMDKTIFSKEKIS